MEESSKKVAYSLKALIEELTTHYQESCLPGYCLHSGDDCPTLIMIGGGDTYREDLFYFVGYPGRKRGCNALMIDLPSQGSNPSRELIFDVNAATPTSLCVDWLEDENPKLNYLAIYSISGGSYFTAQAVEQDTRIQAWIANAPIYDIAEMFKKEFGSSLKASGWLMNAVLRLVGNLNESADLNLQKYAWQFGTTGFKRATDGASKRAEIINYRKVQYLCLFIMGEGGGVELQRQAKVVYEIVKSKNSHTRLRMSEAGSGADTYCQVNNLRLVYNVVSDRLGTLLEQERV